MAFGLSSASGSSLRKARRKAKAAELERLTKVEDLEDRKADFLRTEGKGLGFSANISLFDEEEEVSDEEDLLRRTGQISDTGLFL